MAALQLLENLGDTYLCPSEFFGSAKWQAGKREHVSDMEVILAAQLPHEPLDGIAGKK